MSPDVPVTPAFDIVRSDALAGMPHGFFGTGNGAHQFGFGGPGEAQDVRLLRAAAADAILPGAPLHAPHQVHSSLVVTLGQSWPDAAEGRPVADAVVTARSDIVLGIVTADCAPVLFADRKAGVVGAAHAGWRGAVGDENGSVLDNTIAAMEALGARRADIIAVAGPTIAQASYEVDAGFRENFSPADDAHFAEAPVREGRARWRFDLPGYIITKLDALGLAAAMDIGRDTFSDSAHFYSYRRAVQNNEANYGRHISMIALP